MARTTTSARRMAPGGRLARVVHLDPVGGAVDQVHHVVQPGGQQVDVFPVERGDEYPVQPGHHLMGDLVGLVLQPLDRVHDGSATVSARRLQQVDL